MNDKENKFINIIKKGIPITGAIGGAAVGSIIPWVGTLVGVIAGAAAGEFIKILIEEAINFVARQLSHREEIRVGASVTYTITKIKQLIDDGKKLRQDGFFDIDINERSKAKEIWEGVLTIVKSQYQEKKIELLSNLYAHSAFREDVSTRELYYLMRIIDEVDYEYILILASILTFYDEHNDTSEKIGFIYPSNSAITHKRTEQAQVGYVSQYNPIDVWMTIHPIPTNNLDFYYFYQKLKKLSSLNLINGFNNLGSIEIDNIPQDIIDKYGQQEYSVFYYNFTPENLKLASRYNDLLEFSTIPESELIYIKNHLVSGKQCPSLW